MPITQLVANEWVALADGPILDDIIIKNDHGNDVFVSTEEGGEDRGYIVVRPTERFDIPKNNFAFIRSEVGSLYPWIYNITTAPSGPDDPVAIEVEEEEFFNADLGALVTGNAVTFTLVSVENGGPIEDSNVHVDASTGVVTGSFDNDDVYTITVSATNAAGSDNIAIEVTVVDPV